MDAAPVGGVADVVAESTGEPPGDVLATGVDVGGVDAAVSTTISDVWSLAVSAHHAAAALSNDGLGEHVDDAVLAVVDGSDVGAACSQLQRGVGFQPLRNRRTAVTRAARCRGPRGVRRLRVRPFGRSHQSG